MKDTITETCLTDLVILGRAAPEELADGRQTVCTGAWSPELGFIRLYPIDPQEDLFNRWDVININVERNPKDSRHESWKIKGRKKHQNEQIEYKGQYPREKRATLLHNLRDNCVNEINDEKRSLGIIKPESIDILFEEWEKENIDHTQAKLFNDIDEQKPENRDEFDYNIKINYVCPDCTTKQGYHEQSLLEWGAYMALKKNPNNPNQLKKNYQLENTDYNHWLFVGNLNKYKSTFIVISVIWIKNNVPIHSPLQPFPKTAPNFKPNKI